MKNATKAIAMQVKKRRQDERKTDTGVYGKKLHANQSDVLKVQDVGKN
jgi:LPS sulfotransferase NodH